jgi:hypothetical protein
MLRIERIIVAQVSGRALNDQNRSVADFGRRYWPLVQVTNYKKGLAASKLSRNLRQRELPWK